MHAQRQSWEAKMVAYYRRKGGMYSSCNESLLVIVKWTFRSRICVEEVIVNHQSIDICERVSQLLSSSKSQISSLFKSVQLSKWCFYHDSQQKFQCSSSGNLFFKVSEVGVMFWKKILIHCVLWSINHRVWHLWLFVPLFTTAVIRLILLLINPVQAYSSTSVKCAYCVLKENDKVIHQC